MQFDGEDNAEGCAGPLHDSEVEENHPEDFEMTECEADQFSADNGWM